MLRVRAQVRQVHERKVAAPDDPGGPRRPPKSRSDLSKYSPYLWITRVSSTGTVERVTARRRLPDMNATDRPRLTVRSPADLITAVPYLIGFHPTDSVVVVAMRGRRIVFAARADLPEPGDRPGDAAGATSRRRHRPAGRRIHHRHRVRPARTGHPGRGRGPVGAGRPSGCPCSTRCG